METECKVKSVAKLQRAAELEADKLCNTCYNQFPKEISFSSVIVLLSSENTVCFGAAQ